MILCGSGEGEGEMLLPQMPYSRRYSDLHIYDGMRFFFYQNNALKFN